METKVLEEHTYYRIESPRGVLSEVMTESDLEESRKRGYFTIIKKTDGDKDAYAKVRHKIGCVHKFVRKITLTEEVLA
jgi:intein-encoded DNA endonuclease-like protein